MTLGNSASEIITGAGRQSAAAYLTQQIAAYRGNPFIEALPPILTENQAITALSHFPSYDPGERDLPSHLRLHALQTINSVFVTLPVHLDLEQRFSRMIRGGYVNRNPADPTYWKNLTSRLDNLSLSNAVIANSARPVPSGFTIIGFPGVGKSTSVEAVLSLYPQVIFHTRYGKSELHLAQVVWLKLECPFDGSPRGLCISFFRTIDQLLGTNYERHFAGGRRIIDELLLNMISVAGIHGLGVLVIDEINRLSGCKSDNAQKLLSFFVQLTNTIGIPVVKVGTYKAKTVLSGEFHQIRRGTGQGDLVWDRLQEEDWIASSSGKNEQPLGVWQLLVESLWDYQYTRVNCALTKELAHVLYDETQGITDFAAEVYMLAQIRAIVTAAKPSTEKITTDIIRSVARDSLRQAQPVLSKLRQQQAYDLIDIPDIHPIQIDDFISKAQEDLQKGTVVKTKSAVPQTNENTALIKSDPPNRHKSHKSKPSRQKTRQYSNDDLRAAAEKAKESNSSIVEALREANHIGGISEART